MRIEILLPVEDKDTETITLWGYDVVDRINALPLIDKDAATEVSDPRFPIFAMLGEISLKDPGVQFPINRLRRKLWEVFLQTTAVCPTHKYEEISEERYKCSLFAFDKEDSSL
jgi:hypothetical protein